MLAAVTVVMALLGMLPIGGEISLILLPLPLTILTYEHGWRKAVLPLFAAAILLGFLGQLPLAFAVLFFYGLMGVVMGNSLQKEEPLWRLFGQSLLAGTLGVVILWFLGKVAFGQDAFALMQKGMHEAMAGAMKFYQSLNLSSQQQAMLEQMQKAIGELLDVAIPSMLLLAVMMLLMINFQVSRKIIGRMGGKVAQLPPLARWRLPWYLVWIFIASFLLTGFGGGTIIYKLSLNIYVITMFLYGLQGLAVMANLFGKWGFARGIKILLLMMVFFIFGQLLVFLGLFDTWFDFRKLERAP
jgi:uncharacterized protein YybS (DUF2232 family)